MKDYGFYNNENYEKLENKYLETKNEKYLGEMYKFLKVYYVYKIRAYAKSRGLFFTRNQIDELSHEMAERSVMHYIYHPKIKGDFIMGRLSAYACYDFIKIMFNEKDIELSNIECSLDEILENWDNNQPLFENVKKDNEIEKIDLLIDAKKALPEKEYHMLKIIMDCPTINVDDLAEEFEMPRKQINKMLADIRNWYREEEM